MIYNNILLFNGVVFLLYGILISTGKKVIVYKWAEKLLISSFFWVNPLIQAYFEGRGMFAFVIIILLIIFLFLVDYYFSTFIIYNILFEDLVDMLQDSLNKKRITFIREKQKIILVSNDSKEIRLNGGDGRAEIDLRDIKGTKLYKEIMRNMRSKAKLNNKIKFSSVGSIYLVAGAAIILIDVIFIIAKQF